MLYPRYQSTTSRVREGQVWMLGGRSGSTILQDDEVLQFPSRAGDSWSLKKWVWAHKKMKYIEVWNNAVPNGMKLLPMPLAGHCSVDMDDLVLVIGGGTNEMKEDGTFVHNSGPIPTNHIHLYDKTTDQWA